ncbi:MAG TPA: hypothetical protein VGJ84_06720 [Polyangiaceae bacterium]|jgi:hypothetical protein
MSYRETPRELPPRAEEVRWRVQVAQAAHGLFWALLAGVPLSFVSVYLVIAAQGVAAWCSWRLTSPRPGKRNTGRERLGWAVRALAIADAGRMSALVIKRFNPSPGSVAEWAGSLAAAALAVLGVLYVRALFLEVGDDRAARRARRLAFTYGIALVAMTALGAVYQALKLPYEKLPDSPLGVWLTLGYFISGITLVIASFRALGLLRRLRKTLRVVEHEWWFKPGAGWASLAVSGAGTIEVLEANGEERCFSYSDRARKWLEDSEYVTWEHALADGLVLSVPPPIEMVPTWPTMLPAKARTLVETWDRKEGRNFQCFVCRAQLNWGASECSYCGLRFRYRDGKVVSDDQS